MPERNKDTLLLTGFLPFGGDAFNPSGALAETFDKREIGETAVVRGLLLPVSGPAAWAILQRAIRVSRPRWILALGVSGRECLSVESTAWNKADFSIPDNAGLQPRASRILARGPASLRCGPDVDAAALAAAAGTAELPAEASTDPGRYVCNWTYYRLLHLTRRAGHSACGRTIFLHIPPVEEMRRSPADRRRLFPLDQVASAVERGLRHLTDFGGPSGSSS